MSNILRQLADMVEAFDQTVCDTLSSHDFEKGSPFTTGDNSNVFTVECNRLTTQLRATFFTSCGLLNLPLLLNFCRLYDYGYEDVETTGPNARFTLKVRGYTLVVERK